MNKGFLAALGVFALFSIFAVFLSRFIRVELWIIELTGLLIFGSFLLPITRGIMQGRKKFSTLGWNMILESTLKLGIAILLVSIGFGVYGAIGAVVVSVFLVFIISFMFIREIGSSKRIRQEISGIYSYSLPVFITVLAIVLMYSMDIFFVKRFFSVEDAGKYAAISMLGKMIYFGTLAISKAMFPLTSENFDSGRNTRNIFKKSLIAIILICLVAVVLFLLFPKMIILILFGKEYIEMAGILGYIGITLSILSISNLIVLYGLSTDKIKLNSLFLFVFVILEIILFSIFHTNLQEFSMAFLISNLLMLLGSIIIVRR